MRFWEFFALAVNSALVGFAVGMLIIVWRRKRIWDSQKKKDASLRSTPQLPSSSPLQSVQTQNWYQQMYQQAQTFHPYQPLFLQGSLAEKMPVERVKRPITAYRAFHVNHGGRHWDVTGKTVALKPYLGPVNLSFREWYPGINEAVHCGTGSQKGTVIDSPHKPDPCPAHYQHCGFWMLSDLSSAIVKESWPEAEANWFPVIGVVQGWGRVIEHGNDAYTRTYLGGGPGPEGWRAQYATVIALALPPIHLHKNVTGVAWDFAEETLKRICRYFDVPYIEDVYKLRDVKEKTDSETPA